MSKTTGLPPKFDLAFLTKIIADFDHERSTPRRV